jgi:hypothetical protein
VTQRGRRGLAPALGLALLLAPAAAAAQGADARQAAARILEAQRDSVASVKFVIRNKASFNGREMNADEYRTEACCAVLDRAGLLVCSLIGSNPAEVLSFMDLGSRDGERPDFQSEFADVSVLLPDGSQTPGRVVLRDPDLDLLFVRAEKPDPAWKPLPAEAGPDPSPLDEAVVVGRLGPLLDRAPFADLVRVRAVLKKPRPAIVLDYDTSDPGSGLGLPVFDAAGRTLGILVVRRPPEGQSVAAKQMAFGGFHLDTVVVPWKDVREVAAQAAPAAPAAGGTPAR